MQAQAKIAKSEEIQIEVTVTLTVAELRQIRAALIKGRTGYYGPETNLLDVFSNVISEVEGRFWPEDEKGCAS